MKRIKTLAVFLLIFPSLKSQVDYSDFITSGETNAYYKVAVREREPAPAAYLREADVKYDHRVIRCIDSRQKMNKVLEWPRRPLNEVLYQALWEGSITPYINDSMTTFFSTTEFHKRGGYEVNGRVSTDPEDPDIGYDTTYWVQLDVQSIKKYWVMEEWIFDSKHSVFKPRIIAIAPVFTPKFELISGTEQPLCWIPMDDKLRNLLAKTELFNRYNQAARLSMDDFFQMRIFDSYVVYESNVFDNFINQFEEFENDAVGALLESERIKNDLFIFEHDLWQF